MAEKIYLVRHGETLWAKEGKHTGLTDIPLTKQGIKEAVLLGKRLKKNSFDAIYSSPLLRAVSTAEYAGFSKKIEIWDDLVEWDYGIYEGLTHAEIFKKDPHWSIFTKGAPQGESVAMVERRVRRILKRLRSIKGNVLLFSSGHISRSLAAKWLNLSIKEGAHFALSPASLSLLGFERTTPAFLLWNDISHLNIFLRI